MPVQIAKLISGSLITSLGSNVIKGINNEDSLISTAVLQCQGTFPAYTVSVLQNNAVL